LKPNDRVGAWIQPVRNGTGKLLALNKDVFKDRDRRTTEVGEEDLESRRCDEINAIRTKEADQNLTNALILLWKLSGDNL
jgi:hypothetical protein